MKFRLPLPQPKTTSEMRSTDVVFWWMRRRWFGSDGDTDVQAEEFLSAFASSEPLLIALVSPRGSVFLLNDVAARRGDDFLMIDVCQVRERPECGSIAPHLIGINHAWDIIFTQEPGQEDLRGLGIAVAPQQDIKHEPVLVDSPPEPVSSPVHRRADFVQRPAGTPPGFPLPKVLRKQGVELDAPFAERFMADHNAALVRQLLNIPIAERTAVVQPNGVMNDAYSELVAVGFDVRHGRSAYPDPVQATQPLGLPYGLPHHV